MAKDTPERRRQALRDFGIGEPALTALSNRFAIEDLEAAIRHVRRQIGVANPAGLLISVLQSPGTHPGIVREKNAGAVADELRLERQRLDFERREAEKAAAPPEDARQWIERARQAIANRKLRDGSKAG